MTGYEIWDNSEFFDMTWLSGQTHQSIPHTWHGPSGYISSTASSGSHSHCPHSTWSTLCSSYLEEQVRKQSHIRNQQIFALPCLAFTSNEERFDGEALSSYILHLKQWPVHALDYLCIIKRVNKFINWKNKWSKQQHFLLFTPFTRLVTLRAIYHRLIMSPNYHRVTTDDVHPWF